MYYKNFLGISAKIYQNPTFLCVMYVYLQQCYIQHSTYIIVNNIQDTYSMNYTTHNITSVRLTDEMRSKLMELGDGNMTKGIRNALGIQVETGKELREKTTPTKSSAVQVYMTHQDKAFIKTLGYGNLSAGFRTLITQFKSDHQINQRPKLTPEQFAAELADLTRLNAEQKAKEQEERVLAHLIKYAPDDPRVAQLTTATPQLPTQLPAPPPPALPVKKSTPLWTLNIDQMKRVREYLAIPPEVRLNIMVTTGGLIWVSEYTDPTTQRFHADQELNPSVFDPPL